jgi:hypothetical protein
VAKGALVAQGWAMLSVVIADCVGVLELGLSGAVAVPATLSG